MQLPRRIRLIQSCHAHLYNEVKRTLATDKEIRDLRQLDSKVERYFINLSKPKKMMAICSAGCGFKERFETDEFGLTYFQAEGLCPACNAPTVYPNGKPTKIEVTISIV